jgi:signal transduction histidine kinase
MPRPSGPSAPPGPGVHTAIRPRALPYLLVRRLRGVRPDRVGVLIALTGFVSGLILWWLDVYTFETAGQRSGGWVLIPLVVMCLTAVGRRTAQPWALAVAVIALAGDVATGSLVATVIVFTDAVYAAVVYGPARVSRAVLPVAVAFTVAVTFGLLAVYRNPETLLLGAFSAGVTIAPAWTGVLIRDHSDAAAAERLRAEQTALLAEIDRVQAVTTERARMARELHDVVANHLSAIAIHSTAALSLDRETRDRDEEQLRSTTRDALGVIRENSVQGLAEMRRLIGLLRKESRGSETPLPSPTLAGLDALLARARAGSENTGLHFSLCDERQPGASLPAPVELAAYRVVQESVTNALKHSGSGTVTVELSRTRHPGPLVVRVTSPLAGSHDDLGRQETDFPRAPGSGAGLIGMRERVELLGGTLRAGPTDRPHGTKLWEVRAELPVEEGSPR